MMLALLLLLMPCSQSAEAATAPAVAAAPTATAAAATTAAGDASLATPSDDMLKLRDPFKRPDIEIGKVVPKGELENFTIDSFKMVAVLTGPNRMRAMLLAPDGKNYMVHSGMKIGTRNGVIQKITSEAVEVRERIINVLGQEENVDSEIPLQADAKSMKASK